MKTKLEIIAELKTQHPTLQVGSEEIGYTELSTKDYEATIETWAEDLYSKSIAEAKTLADKEALLAKLGITADEAKLLLS